MRSLVKPLAIILIAQLALFAALDWSSNSFEPFNSDEPILTFDKSKINKVNIETAEQKFEALKKDKKWVLPAINNFPADSDKISELVTQLSYAPRSIPVGSTKNTQKQLKVLDDSFEKKITLSGDNVKAELIIGTSPSFKKNYVRNAAEDTVFNIETGNWELSPDPKAWLDFEYLYFEPSKVSMYTSEDFEITVSDNKYTIQGSDKNLDQTKVSDYIKQLSEIKFTELLEKDPVVKSSKADFYFSVMLPDKERVYNFYKDGKDSNYILKLQGSDYTFKVPGAYVKELSETTIESLIETPKEAETEETS
ncbi:MAG: DUF4340 domain-containing protein [Bdellovibrionota bacterium]